METDVQKLIDLVNKAKSAPSGEEILHILIGIANLLIDKNISYGDSALSPNNIFGNLSAEDALYCRINDKLSRIANNQTYQSEYMQDAVIDIIGYCTLLLVLFNRED